MADSFRTGIIAPPRRGAYAARVVAAVASRNWGTPTGTTGLTDPFSRVQAHLERAVADPIGLTSTFRLIIHSRQPIGHLRLGVGYLPIRGVSSMAAQRRQIRIRTTSIPTTSSKTRGCRSAITSRNCAPECSGRSSGSCCSWSSDSSSTASGRRVGNPKIGIGKPMLKVITDPVEIQVRDFYYRRNRAYRRREAGPSSRHRRRGNRPDSREARREQLQPVGTDRGGTGQVARRTPNRCR